MTQNAFKQPDWEGWIGSSSDPNDRQFGNVVSAVESDTAADTDVVLVGEPYDGAVISRRGAREAPLEIRRSLAAMKTTHLSAGEPGSQLGDLGDLNLPETDVAGVQKSVQETATDIYKMGPLPVFLGGDNSLTYGNVAPLLDANRDVGVINFDAHLDCREVQGGPTSGTPYRQLHEAGLDTYIAVGARHFETSTAYIKYVREQDGTIIPADTFVDGPNAVTETIQDALMDVDVLYLSVDCDVLEASAAPGVSAPTPGGLTTRELFSAVRTLAADERLAGVEVVECAPPLDTDGLTVDAAARTVAHAISGYLEIDS